MPGPTLGIEPTLFGVSLNYNLTGIVTVKTEPRGATVSVGGGSSTVTPRLLGTGQYELT